MAMPFSRPNPSSLTQVADASFSTGRRGFDQKEVREFLRTVSVELGRLRERETFLEGELTEARNNPDLDNARLDDEALTRLLGEETARVLNAARESAHEIREKAEQSAARMVVEASDEATRMREEAEIEASRRRTDATADAEAELSMAKQQGREMVNEARAYRERVLSELARRRELARQQIEQLVHGRDRLMQAFERARLVAVDVVSEMQPLGEPDEYVNLQPSTGPVPLMVAREGARDDTTAGELPVFEPVAGPSTGSEVFDGRALEDSDEASNVTPLTTDDSDTSENADETDADADTVDAADSGDAAEDVIETITGDDAAVADAAAGDVTDTDTDTVIEDEDEIVTDTVTDDADSDAEDEIVADTVTEDEDEIVAAADATDEATDGTADEVEVEVEVEVEADQVSTQDASDDVDVDAGDVDQTETSDRSDVVVDLFARLRADAAPDQSPSDDTTAVTEIDTEIETDDDASDTVFDRRSADLTPLIVSSARKLKRVLADEQNDVLDALRRSDPVRNLDALVPWASDHTTRYASVINEELLGAANAGAALHSVGRPTKLRKAAGQLAVADATEQLGHWLIQTLRDRLERCVSEGDGDNAAITQKIRAVYREFKTRHIDEQLDDVIRVAHGRGVLAALELDAPVAWTPDPSHDVCADCDDNRLAGAVAAGQPFPTGQVCTPAHPGCRCILVPIAR